MLGGVLVQRFGDLVKERTNEHRLGKSFTRPTLTAAVLGICPRPAQAAAGRHHRDDLCPGQDRPGTANHDTLLYGAEVKFYSALQLTPELETAIPTSCHAATLGVTRGLAQAGPPASRRPGPSSSGWTDRRSHPQAEEV